MEQDACRRRLVRVGVFRAEFAECLQHRLARRTGASKRIHNHGNELRVRAASLDCFAVLVEFDLLVRGRGASRASMLNVACSERVSERDVDEVGRAVPRKRESKIEPKVRSAWNCVRFALWLSRAGSSEAHEQIENRTVRTRTMAAVEAGQRVITKRVAVVLAQVAPRMLLADGHSEAKANRDVEERFVQPELRPDRVDGRVEPQAGVTSGECEKSGSLTLIRALLQTPLLSLQLQRRREDRLQFASLHSAWRSDRRDVHHRSRCRDGSRVW